MSEKRRRGKTFGTDRGKGVILIEEQEYVQEGESAA